MPFSSAFRLFLRVRGELLLLLLDLLLLLSALVLLLLLLLLSLLLFFPLSLLLLLRLLPLDPLLAFFELRRCTLGEPRAGGVRLRRRHAGPLGLGDERRLEEGRLLPCS